MQKKRTEKMFAFFVKKIKKSSIFNKNKVFIEIRNNCKI